MPSLVLASASPARLGLLRAAGITPAVVVSGVDEESVESAARAEDPHLSPGRLAQLLAEAKGAQVRRELPDDARLVLACDSVLEFSAAVHGKPRTPQAARERWLEMRGRAGVLHTGHWLHEPHAGRSVGASASATVHFADVDEAEIEGYVASAEPLHVAGGFTLDGLGAPFVESVEGHPSTVVGLCLPLLRRMLADLDVAWWDLAGS